MNQNDNEFNILDIDCPEQKMMITCGVLASNAVYDRASWTARKALQIRKAKGAQSK
jgi:1-aminocyclopropane-1-carboxylate deaminase/D-cysteine desulfhydrase-like pyridoxal-dependent ACC family enzyme